MKKFDFFLNLKVPKKYLDISSYWNDLFQQILDLLTLCLFDHSSAIYFPEVCISVLRELKQIKKEVVYSGYKAKITHLVK